MYMITEFKLEADKAARREFLQFLTDVKAKKLVISGDCVLIGRDLLKSRHVIVCSHAIESIEKYGDGLGMRITDIHGVEYTVSLMGWKGFIPE